MLFYWIWKRYLQHWIQILKFGYFQFKPHVDETGQLSLVQVMDDKYLKKEEL
jgi:hypothetical protein